MLSTRPTQRFFFFFCSSQRRFAAAIIGPDLEARISVRRSELRRRARVRSLGCIASPKLPLSGTQNPLTSSRPRPPPCSPPWGHRDYKCGCDGGHKKSANPIAILPFCQIVEFLTNILLFFFFYLSSCYYFYSTISYIY